MPKRALVLIDVQKDYFPGGAMSHMCVDAGARAASDLGYRCVVVHDACAIRDQEFEGVVVSASEVHAAFIAVLRFGYARLVSTDDYLTY
jgi:nicotinamidase-related amidase